MPTTNDQFYEVTGKKNERQITVLSPTLLVGKAPTKEKRIRMRARMFLAPKSNAGAPEWLHSAFLYVSQHHQTVEPPERFSGYQLHFSTENLFGPKGAKSPKCILRKFVVEEFGDSDDPDVVVTFTIVAGFSTKLWNYLGQVAGDEIWCQFVPGAASEEEDEDGEDEDGEEEEEGKEKPGKPAKSGPKQLLAFHQTQAEDGKAKK